MMKHDGFVVGIGASAVDLGAIATFFEQISADSEAAFIVVQASASDVKWLRQEQLEPWARMTVQQVEADQMIEPNHIYLIAACQHFVMVEGRLQRIDAREGLPHPSHLPIDTLFDSLAQTRGDRVIGVVFSGAGGDGEQGLQSIRAAGGLTFRQSAATVDGDRLTQTTAGRDDQGSPAAIARTINALLQKQRSVTVPLAASGATLERRNIIPIHQAEREHLLLEITKRIRESLDLHQIFATACREIRQVMHVDRVGIFQFDPQSQGNDGRFVAEALVAGYPSALDQPVHDHCFGENYATLYVQGKYYAVADIETAGLTPCHREILAQFAVKANLVMPLIRGEVLWGLLCLHQCDRPREWRADELELACQLSNQLAIAIQQAALYQQVQAELLTRQQTEARLARQLAQQTALAKITERIRQSLELETILTIVTEEIKALLDGDRVIVFRVAHDAPSRIIAEAVSSDVPSVKGQQWENETWSAEVLNLYWQGQPRIVPDVMADAFTDCLINYARTSQIQSKIVAPILQEDHSTDHHRWLSKDHANRVWGILVVHACQTQRVWEESEAQFLQQVANQLAIAIQQIDLFQQLQQELEQRKQAQIELTNRNYDLEQATQRANAASQTKSAFLANMSHEIRTPMNAILGFSELLQNNITDPAAKAYLQAIQSNGRILLTLINDILDLSKVEAGQLTIQYEAINFHALLLDIHNIFTHRAQEKELTLTLAIATTVPPCILMDEIRLRQILFNILGNAVKFTPKGGQVTIQVNGTRKHRPSQPQTNTEATSTQRGDNDTYDIEIIVADTGIGISPEQQSIIFDAFHQAQGQPERQYGGTGLGLTITRRLMEMMGGTITVQSVVQQGSSFILNFVDVQIPIATKNCLDALTMPRGSLSHQDTEPLPSLQQLPPLSVLVVDDVQSNLDLLASYFVDTPHHLWIADNGQQALQLAQQHRPDVILLDLVMPPPDGRTLLQHLRQDSATAQIPIILITASIQEQEIEELQSLLQGFLRKPVTQQAIASQLQQLFGTVPAPVNPDPRIATPTTSPTAIAPTPMTISPAQQEHLTELLQRLQTEEDTVWQTLHQSLLLDQVRLFAEKLDQWAIAYAYPPLTSYVALLKKQLEQFDLENLPTTVTAFPNLKIQLKQQLTVKTES